MTRQETIKTAFLAVIKAVGMAEFKKCSFFIGGAK